MDTLSQTIERCHVCGKELNDHDHFECSGELEIMGHKGDKICFDCYDVLVNQVNPIDSRSTT